MVVVAAAVGMGYKAVETGFCHFRGEETTEALQENESLPFLKKVKTSGYYIRKIKKTIKVNYS